MTTIQTMTTTLRTIARLVAAIDWRTIGRTTAQALAVIAVAAQLLLAAAVLIGEIAWEHRAQIRQPLVAAIAATYVAGCWTRHHAERCLRAGQWIRQQINHVCDRSVALLPEQPIEVLAPITAVIAAAREALSRLIARLYPALAA